MICIDLTKILFSPAIFSIPTFTIQQISNIISVKMHRESSKLHLQSQLSLESKPGQYIKYIFTILRLTFIKSSRRRKGYFQINFIRRQVLWTLNVARLRPFWRVWDTEKYYEYFWDPFCFCYLGIRYEEVIMLMQKTFSWYDDHILALLNLTL